MQLQGSLKEKDRVRGEREREGGGSYPAGFEDEEDMGHTTQAASGSRKSVLPSESLEGTSPANTLLEPSETDFGWISDLQNSEIINLS